MPRLYEEDPDDRESETRFDTVATSAWPVEKRSKREPSPEKLQRDAAKRAAKLAAADERSRLRELQRMKSVKESLLLRVAEDVKRAAPSIVPELFVVGDEIRCTLKYPVPGLPTYTFAAPENPTQFVNAFIGKHVRAATEALLKGKM